MIIEAFQRPSHEIGLLGTLNTESLNHCTCWLSTLITTFSQIHSGLLCYFFFFFFHTGSVVDQHELTSWPNLQTLLPSFWIQITQSLETNMEHYLLILKKKKKKSAGNCHRIPNEWLEYSRHSTPCFHDIAKKAQFQPFLWHYRNWTRHLDVHICQTSKYLTTAPMCKHLASLPRFPLLFGKP